MANTGTEMSARAVTVGEGAQEGYAPALDVQPCSDMWSVPLARAGWDDLPRELHREVLRLVPLRDATAARGVSPQMRDQVDEVWRAWGIRATAEDRQNAVLRGLFRAVLLTELDFGPLMVYAFQGSHAHHLASLGLWWLALLVAEGPDFNGVTWHVAEYRLPDQSPLMVAVRARRPVGRGADGKVQWAYALGDGEVTRAVRVAVATGADVNRRLDSTWTLMTYCAMRGCSEAVKACLAAGAEVDAGWGWKTALVHAARGGHEAVVEALLEAGASAAVGRDGRDETLTLVCDGHPTPGIVRRLVEAGADVNSRNHSGTALMHAVRRGNVAVMEVLVELGANVEVIHDLDWADMPHALTGEVVRWLVARGLRIQFDEGYDSPLGWACGQGRVDAVRALIELGADVNGKTDNGWAPLHFAVRSEEHQAVEITQLLLGAGADAGAADESGRTPLHDARHAACVDLLLDAGADLEARLWDHRTPIYIAAMDRHEDMTEVVLRMADRDADMVNTGGEPGLVMRRVEELRAQRSRGQAS